MNSVAQERTSHIWKAFATLRLLSTETVPVLQPRMTGDPSRKAYQEHGLLVSRVSDTRLTSMSCLHKQAELEEQVG